MPAGLPAADDPTVDAARAATLVAASFPDLSGAPLVHLGRGWDHDVWRCGPDWVLRFPRNGAAAEALEREFVALPVLAPRLPLPIAVPLRRGAFDGGWSFSGHRWLAGRTLCDAQLDTAARARLAPSLGAFLRALHAVPAADVPVALPGDTLGRTDVARRGTGTREMLASFRADGSLPGDVVERLLGALDDCPQPRADEAPVVVHADMHVRNLLAEGGAITGVIDWVDLHLGDRALDLAAAFEVVPQAARAEFLAAYGGNDADTLARARWRAVDHMTRTVAGTRTRGDAAFERAARNALVEMSR